MYFFLYICHFICIFGNILLNFLNKMFRVGANLGRVGKLETYMYVLA